MKPIIRVENLSKQYTIGAKAEPYSTLRESLVSAVRKPIDMLRLSRRKSPDSKFWAVKDVSFDVMPGEVVGIIGRNGAGKSTLLKILSRITEPTTGKVELFGRVGSLLEVGTGFHPELTGRENIFLNGAILGMRREEINKKFDEIVDFAEIEEFLDTPVKRYSSGMYMKLAFAVAANLEPEILVVDEVLAVGDAQFQRKCLGKMKDLSEHGRTVLFVSHNMHAVAQLCTHGLMMENGQVRFRGPIDKVVEHYLSSSKDGSSYTADDDPKVASQILFCEVVNSNGEQASEVNYNESITLRFKIKNWSPEEGMVCAVSILDMMEQFLTVDCMDIRPETGFQTHQFVVPAGLLVPGRLKFAVSLFIPGVRTVGLVTDSLEFEILDVGFELRKYGNIETGVVRSNADWTFEASKVPLETSPSHLNRALQG